MKKIEMIQILTEAKLLYGHQEASEPEINAWFNYFGTADAKQFHEAMKATVKSQKYFPTPGDVQDFLIDSNMPEILTLSAQEALDRSEESQEILILNAKNFARRNTPDNSKTQYSSPEELNKANHINRAIWERNFKEHFEQTKDRVKNLIYRGHHYREALTMIVAGSISTQREIELMKQLGMAK